MSLSFILYLAIGFLCSFIILWFSYDNRSVYPQVDDSDFFMAVFAIPLWFIIMPLFILLKIVYFLTDLVEYIKSNKKTHIISVQNKFNIGTSGTALGLSNKEELNNDKAN